MGGGNAWGDLGSRGRSWAMRFLRSRSRAARKIMTGFSTDGPILMTGSMLFGRFGHPAAGAGEGGAGGVEPFRHRGVGELRLLRFRFPLAEKPGMLRIAEIVGIVQFALARLAHPAESVVVEIVEILHQNSILFSSVASG